QRLRRHGHILAPCTDTRTGLPSRATSSAPTRTRPRLAVSRGLVARAGSAARDGLGRGGRLEADHAVAPALAAVDDRGLARLGLDEEEEVVPHELHLVQRVVDRHGVRLVDLLADHDRGVAERVLDRAVLGDRTTV